MKRSILKNKLVQFSLGLVLIFGIIKILEIVLPTEAEREAAKMHELVNRNALEKQFVGKWNHTEYPAGMENGRYYHLLSADASYFYRASDNGKLTGGSWKADPKDSILYIIRDPENSMAFKIKSIRRNHITLQIIKNDSLARVIEWFRHP